MSRRPPTVRWIFIFLLTTGAFLAVLIAQFAWVYLSPAVRSRASTIDICGLLFYTALSMLPLPVIAGAGIAQLLTWLPLRQSAAPLRVAAKQILIAIVAGSLFFAFNGFVVPRANRQSFIRLYNLRFPPDRLRSSARTSELSGGMAPLMTLRELIQSRDSIQTAGRDNFIIDLTRAHDEVGADQLLTDSVRRFFNITPAEEAEIRQIIRTNGIHQSPSDRAELAAIAKYELTNLQANYRKRTEFINRIFQYPLWLFIVYSAIPCIVLLIKRRRDSTS